MKLCLQSPVKALLTATLASGLLFTPNVQAAPFVKKDNATALDVDGSYTTVGVPGALDTIVVDSTLEAARAVTAGSGVNVRGLDFQASQNQNFSINGSGSVTIGVGGMLKNTANLVQLSAPITLSAAQTWEVNSGTLRFTSTLTTGGNALDITGAGTLQLRGVNQTYGSDVTISVAAVSNDQPSAVVTLGGANTFETLNWARGRVVGATLGNFGEASNFGSGGVSAAILLGTSSAGGTLEYTGVTDTSNRTFNRNASNVSLATGIIEVSSIGQTLTLTGDLTSSSSTTDGSWQFGGAGNLTLQGVISDQGNIGVTSVVKADSGTLTLEADNTFEGTITVTGGTLLVNNLSGSGLGLGNATVNAGTLGGTGSFSGSVTVNTGGTLSPGTSIETLGSGNLTFNTGSTFEYEVDSGVALAVGADLQKVTGDLDLNGTVTFTFTDLNMTPGAFAAGTTFSLINYSGNWNNGLFTYNASTIANGSNFSDGLNTWQLTYDATSGGSNFTGEYVGANFVNITVVPEPTSVFTVALLAGGLLTLAIRRRRIR